MAQRIFHLFVESELREMSIFADPQAGGMKELAPLFCLEQHAGDRIFSEGEPGNKVFIMLHGVVVVRKGALELAVLDAAGADEHHPLRRDGHPRPQAADGRSLSGRRASCSRST